MKIHKATDTNVTACGISAPGKVMAINWKDVDCIRCLKAGNQPPLKQITELELNNNQPELNLPEDTTQ